MKIKIMKSILSISIASTLLISYLFSSNYENCINKSNDIINLIGENHYNEECINIKNQLLKKVRDGRIILAIEGIFGEREPTLDLFAIEDQYTWALVRSCDYCHQFALYKITKNLHTLKDETWSTVIEVLERDFNEFFSPPSESLSEMAALLNLLNINQEHPIYKKNLKIATKLSIFSILQSSPLIYEKKIAAFTKYHSFETPFS